MKSVKSDKLIRNASQVLSRAHAAFLSSKGRIYLKDNGSRNGSFINNHRLSKNFQESEENVLYSNDVIR